VAACQGRFLVHVKALAKLFRGKVRAALQQLGWARELPAAMWSTTWVVDCRGVGSGEAALTYLAPYVFRVALSNNRIVSLVNDQVTFRYRVAETKKTKTGTLPAETFIARFLQHVVPKGFVKVRSYGLFRSGNRPLLAQVRAMLVVPAISASGAVVEAIGGEPSVPLVMCCPVWGAQMELMETLPPASRSPPALLVDA
jgi:hypothetical protein